MFDDDDDNSALLELLGDVLYWCFWPKGWRQWLLYVAALAVLTYLKSTQGK